MHAEGNQQEMRNFTIIRSWPHECGDITTINFIALDNDLRLSMTSILLTRRWCKYLANTSIRVSVSNTSESTCIYYDYYWLMWCNCYIYILLFVLLLLIIIIIMKKKNNMMWKSQWKWDKLRTLKEDHTSWIKKPANPNTTLVTMW